MFCFGILTPFLFLTEMVVNFAEHREADRRVHEATLWNTAVNPARAMDQSSLAVATSLEDTTTPIITPHASAGQSL